MSLYIETSNSCVLKLLSNQSNQKFFDNESNQEAVWSQKLAFAEEEYKKHVDLLKVEISDAKHDSKTQTKAAIEAQTQLSQAISYGKSFLAGAKKWETEVGVLSSEVKKLRSENLALVEQLAEVREATFAAKNG